MINLRVFTGIMMFVLVASLCISSVASAQMTGRGKGNKGFRALQWQIDAEGATRATEDSNELTPGPQGEQGEVESQGPQGEQGPQGVVGADGAVGAVGAQGPAGPAGVDGAQGSAGADGPQGPQGPQGEQGEQGPQGVAGVDGIDGAVGAAGAQGPAGLAGAVGAQGPAGAVGAADPQGSQGVSATSPWIENAGNVYYDGGNLGIGTTTPSGRFSVVVRGVGNRTSFIDAVPAMTGYMTPSGMVTASSENVAGGFVRYVWAAFDNLIGHSISQNFWQVSLNSPNPPTGWLQYEFDQPTIIKAYSLQALADSLGQMPRDWTLIASNTGTFSGEEVTLDSQGGIAFSSSEHKVFNISNSTAYQYYRINVAANTDGDFLLIGEMELLHELGSTDIAIEVTNEGNIGIGTTIPSRKLFVNGDAGGTTGWFNDSDIRLKKSIVTIANALGKVEKLRGVQFEWKDTNNHPEGKQIGFVAQEAKSIMPEVVSKKGEHLSMQYGPITALLVEAIKELKSENEQLKEKLTSLVYRQETLEDMFLAISANLQNEKLVKFDNAELVEVQSNIQ